MSAIVVDASIVVEYLLRTPRGARLESLLREPATDLHVPALCDVEVAAVLRRALLGRRLGIERAYDALEDYLDLPLARHGHAYLLGRMVGLRRNFSAYDATYVALSEWLAARLATADEALARAVGAHTQVELC
ncbi:MAG: type II toxin-antitoxin system VapC family toxin [Acidobacteriota bacterium]|nr:type II toxin-antitoxin system VapC family toxin [Acidobacteriota bacterium]